MNIKKQLFTMVLCPSIPMAGCTPNSFSNVEGTDTSQGSQSTGSTSESTVVTSNGQENDEKAKSPAMLLYQGHGSLRIITSEGKVIYIDPYAGKGYNVPADLILITHSHPDHTAIDLIQTQNLDCVTITHEEALIDGEHKTFKLDYVTIEAVKAGNNPNHDINVCVGYVLTLNDGKSIYVTGDTSKTEQMATLAERNLDYAFFCCDGIYNMDVLKAAECAALVGAKNNIPYHISPGEDFNLAKAELFEIENRLIITNGEEITL